MAKSFSLSVRKWNFFEEKFFLKAFLCTRITQFWLARLLSFARKLITFSSVSAKDKKNIYFFPKNLFFVKVFFWTLTKQFWQTVQKLLDRRLKYFCSVFFKKMYCRNYKSHQNNPRAQKMQFWGTCQKFIVQAPENFRSMSQNNRSGYFFSEVSGTYFIPPKGSSG